MDKIVKALKQEINKYHGLDFVGTDIHKLTNSYHPYPAAMIPQLPDVFLDALKSDNIKNVFDPFMGSGTTLVESLAHNINGYGIDMNPLSVLIAKAETTYLNQNFLDTKSDVIMRAINDQHRKLMKKKLHLKTPKFKNINYWFKPYVINDLQIIKNAIKNNSHGKFRNFFMVAFSKTVHYVSNSRNNEFKMYRINKNKLPQWHPDVIGEFAHDLMNNIKANKSIEKCNAKIKAIWGDSGDLPFKMNSFDSLITSPPYGDSRTTVAYGQFSRLSLQWLDLKMQDVSNKKLTPEKIAMKVDKYLLGGHKSFKEIKPTRSKTLNHYLRLIAQDKPKRALQVFQFYADLDKVLEEVAVVMKPNSHQFWVTGNRTVDGYQIPTDIIIEELFNKYNVQPVGKFHRDISNKRMPLKNSPTNHKGRKSSTMKQEIITIYKTLK